MKRKIINFPTQYKEYSMLAEYSIQQDKIDSTIHYTLQAIALCNNKNHKKNLNLQLAKLYCNVNNINYSNYILFKILRENPNCKQAYLMLMLNMFTLGNSQLGQHYFQKCNKIFDKILKNNVQIINEEKQIEFDDVSDAVQFMKQELLQQSKFSVINSKTRLKKNLTKGYLALSYGYFKKALEIFVAQIQPAQAHISQLVEIYTAIASCHMNLQNEEQCYDYLLKALQLQPKNIDALILMYVYAQKHDMQDIQKNCVDTLITCDIDDYNDVYKVVSYLNDDKFYNEALGVLKKQIAKHPYKYDYNKFMAIVLFNMGEKESAENIFIDMKSLFGNIINANNFLFYMRSELANEPIKIEIMGDTLPKLTSYYENKIIELNKMTLEQIKHSLSCEEVWECINWLAEIPKHNQDLHDFIGKMLLNFTQQCCQKFGELLCKNFGIQKPIKISICFYSLRYCLVDKISLVDDNIFYNINVKLNQIKEATTNDIFVGYCRAISIIIADGQSNINKLFKTTTEFIKLQKEKLLEFSDHNCIAGVLLKLAFGEDLLMTVPFLEFDKILMQKYYNMVGLEYHIHSDENLVENYLQNDWKSNNLILNQLNEKNNN